MHTHTNTENFNHMYQGKKILPSHCNHAFGRAFLLSKTMYDFTVVEDHTLRLVVCLGDNLIWCKQICRRNAMYFFQNDFRPFTSVE